MALDAFNPQHYSQKAPFPTPLSEARVPQALLSQGQVRVLNPVTTGASSCHFCCREHLSRPGMQRGGGGLEAARTSLSIPAPLPALRSDPHGGGWALADRGTAHPLLPSWAQQVPAWAPEHNSGISPCPDLRPSRVGLRGGAPPHPGWAARGLSSGRISHSIVGVWAGLPPAPSQLTRSGCTLNLDLQG